MQCVTAACWIIRKSVFTVLGGFDNEFKNGCEDVDLCLRCREAGYRIVYAGKSAIYHHSQATPGRQANDASNEQLLRMKWRGRLIPDIHKFTDTAPWEGPAKNVTSPVPVRRDADIHFSAPLQLGNAFSWTAVRLAAACEASGMKVSIEPSGIDTTIDPNDRALLKRFMKRPQSRKFQVRWGHFWQPYLDRTLTGEINAEVIALNYLYPPKPEQNLDFWMRHTVKNGYIKLPVSNYCAESLRNIGVPDDRNLVLHHGYSPEILKSRVVDPRFADFDFVLLAVTNSHDPYRYGTDVLIEAFQQAFAGRSDVVLVLKDYGAQTGIIDAWVHAASQSVAIRHLKEFVSKADLIGLYRSAHVLVAPFRGEGFGMKIVDACALGMPIIAPGYGGPKDFLIEGDFYSVAFEVGPVTECLDSIDGIVPPYTTWCSPNVDDLAAKMIRSYEDHRRGLKLGEKNKSLVLENFSWDAQAKRLAEIIDLTRVARESVVSPRRCEVVGKEISVVIPTFRRPVELRKTLEAYSSQTLKDDCWEMIVSDDCSGPEFGIGDVVSEFKDRIPVTFRAMSKNAGPGNVRNDAVLNTSGNVVVFAGDDIVPSRQFLAEHLKAQKGLAGPAAVLGYIGWDRDLPISELMDFITAEGGHQFFYFAMKPYKPTNPLYFYASNISLPRALLVDQEVMFNPNFTGYGHEDSELGYRLNQRSGMKVYFNPDALGFHNHPMPDEYIYRRQYNAGIASVTLYLMHPELRDRRTRQAFEMLELIQQASLLGETFDEFETGTEFETFFRAMCEHMDRSWSIKNRLNQIMNGLPRGSQRTPISDTALRAARPHMLNARLWMAELCGMADGWFGTSSGRSAAAKFLLCEDHFRSLWTLSDVPNENLTGLQERVAAIERLRQTHPVLSSALGSIVRVASGIAKRV
jgi:GT2 family glycosyltransferase/glycosyltransferase involved in cell wall biosynthesis